MTWTKIVRPCSTSPDGLTKRRCSSASATGGRTPCSAQTSRTVSEILRTNIFTFFNGLLLTLFVVILATGRWQNGLFGLVIVANSAIGIIQELRAKRTLDQLSRAERASAPGSSATARCSEIDIADVVADDLRRAADRRPGPRRRLVVEAPTAWRSTSRC